MTSRNERGDVNVYIRLVWRRLYMYARHNQALFRLSNPSDVNGFYAFQYTYLPLR